MKGISKNSSLSDLQRDENLSIRSINICGRYGLMTLQAILDFYQLHRSFLVFQNCGEKTHNELTALCKKYSNGFDIDLTEPTNKTGFNANRYLERIELLSPFQKSILNRHFEHLLSNLNIRAYNGMAQVSADYNSKVILHSIFSEEFSFKNLKNIGEKSSQELEGLKSQLIKFISILETLEKEQLNREYIKLIIKTTFINLNESFDAQLDNIFVENNKIKIFSLLNLLIEAGEIFMPIEKRIFTLIFKSQHKSKKVEEILPKEFNLTKERIRQIKIKMEESIEDYFLFISSFVLDDLINYNIDAAKNFEIISSSFENKINESEGLDFSLEFYCIIYGILLKKTHIILGNYRPQNERVLVFRKGKYKNSYLIKLDLFESFDFEEFVEDIFQKSNSKINESYSLHFQGYLFKFIKNDKVEFLESVISICEAILFHEFDLIVDSTGYLCFERNTKKQMNEYCYEVLDANCEPMSLEQIQSVLYSMHPDFIITLESLRAILSRDRLRFIYFGRSSTYGLRKWEKEKENIKGGTIRDIVEDFLMTENKPQHISKILKHVQKYRVTNEKNVFTNLKLDESKKFVFFKNTTVGLSYKKYDSRYMTKVTEYKNWDERFVELKAFREHNPDSWPTGNSPDKLERSLYLLGYKARKAYIEGKLDIQKEQLLRSINFPLKKANQ